MQSVKTYNRDVTLLILQHYRKIKSDEKLLNQDFILKSNYFPSQWYYEMRNSDELLMNIKPIDHKAALISVDSLIKIALPNQYGTQYSQQLIARNTECESTQK